MPNQKVLDEKKKIVQELADKMKAAATGVLVDYRGLSVEADTQLRVQLRNAGVDYKVVKNTLTRFAANQIGFEALDGDLNGPTAMALSGDLIAPAKILVEFAKKNDKLQIKSGFIEGKVVDANQIRVLAELPPKEVLVARALGSLIAPISGFANVLNANLRGLVVALDAIRAQQA